MVLCRVMFGVIVKCVESLLFSVLLKLEKFLQWLVVLIFQCLFSGIFMFMQVVLLCWFYCLVWLVEKFGVLLELVFRFVVVFGFIVYEVGLLVWIWQVFWWNLFLKVILIGWDSVFIFYLQLKLVLVFFLVWVRWLRLNVVGLVGFSEVLIEFFRLQLMVLWLYEVLMFQCSLGVILLCRLLISCRLFWMLLYCGLKLIGYSECRFQLGKMVVV